MLMFCHNYVHSACLHPHIIMHSILQEHKSNVYEEVKISHKTEGLHILLGFHKCYQCYLECQYHEVPNPPRFPDPSEVRSSPEKFLINYL